MVESHNFQSFCCHLRATNLANVAQKRIISEHSTNKCTPQVWMKSCEYLFLIMVGNLHFDSFSFFGTRGPKLGQHGPKLNQFRTLTQQMHTPNLKSIEWSLPDNGRKPRTDWQTDRRTDTWMHGRALKIAMSLPEFLGGNNKFNTLSSIYRLLRKCNTINWFVITKLNRMIFIIEIRIVARRHFYIETVPVILDVIKLLRLTGLYCNNQFK